MEKSITDFMLYIFKVDRSPTGSGVTARIAVQHHKQQIAQNDPFGEGFELNQE